MLTRSHALFDEGRREAVFFSTLAAILVLIRSVVFLVWGHIDFDSDQAIVGLMAKHLSEFRTFPLFYYGQNYMLGVQAWIIAPFFWILRPSVAVLKLPLVLLNIMAAVLLIRSISSRLQLRPAICFVAALPFIVPAPVVASTYLQTLGSSGVEPLLYVLFLWSLRDRPRAFGILLAVGFLHREFTIYAIPALLATHLTDRSAWTSAHLPWLWKASTGFALVWVGLDYVRLHLEGASLFLQAQQLGRLTCLRLAELLDRTGYLFTEVLPALSGATVMTLYNWGLRSSTVVGAPIIGWIAGGAMLLMIVRLAYPGRLTRGEHSVAFPAYLALVGCCALAGYLLTCTFIFEQRPILRYLNLAMLLPIGCFSAFMTREPSAQLRSVVIAAFLVWGTANTIDHVRLIQDTRANPMPNPHRQLTDFLLSQQIRFARAPYWDAYVVDFLSRERVIVGSFGPQRIPEYERLVDANQPAAVHIQRLPCEGWTEVADWCIQLPARLIDERPR
jgi:hypothetical protein